MRHRLPTTEEIQGSHSTLPPMLLRTTHPVWLNNPWNRPIKRRDCRGALERSEKLRKAPPTVFLWCEVQRRVRGSVLVSVDVPVAEKPQVEVKRSRGWGRESRPNSRRQWSRWHPGKRSQPGRRRVRVPRICGSFYGGWISQKVFGVVPKGRREEGGKKATRSDEWHNWISRCADSSLRLDYARPRTLTKIPSSDIQGKLKHWGTLRSREISRNFRIEFFTEKEESEWNCRDTFVKKLLISANAPRSIALESVWRKVCKQASLASAPLTIQPGYTILTRCVQGTNAAAE